MKYPVIGRSVAICVAALVVFCPRAAMAQQVKLSFEAGRVTLDARDVTIREVLDEWARRGNVVVVNAELVGDRRVSLRLDGVLEQRALEAVLRGVAGYVIVERGPETAGPAVFGRLFVVAPSELAAVPPEVNGVDRGALTPSDDSLAKRLPLEVMAPNRPSDSAFDQEVAVANAEPPDGRPEGMHLATEVMGDRTGRTPGSSTVVEPPDGRVFEAFRILARPIGPRWAPALGVAPVTSAIGELKGAVIDEKNVKDANGREAMK